MSPQSKPRTFRVLSIVSPKPSITRLSMQTIASIKSLQAQIRLLRQQSLSIGFVPTMGNLHDGHLSLVHLAKLETDKTVVSIFVNPKQFGPSEDLASYPRTLADDTTKLQEAGVDVLFVPAEDEIYPSGVENHTEVYVPALSNILCGETRPVHFAGVTTVVCKLLNIVNPDLAVFGEKDYQQLILIKKMVKDLHLPVRIDGGPIVREDDGVAMSSRNRYLSKTERKTAPRLHQALLECRQKLQDGERNFERLQSEQFAKLASQGFKPDYVSIRNPQSLEESSPDDAGLIILIAAYLGKTRLIDNLLVSLR